MLSTICSAKQKSLQMCGELRHCQRWVTNRKRQRVPQWRTRDGKPLSVSRRSWSRYRQIAACCRSEMTSVMRGRKPSSLSPFAVSCSVLIATLTSRMMPLVFATWRCGHHAHQCITRNGCRSDVRQPSYHERLQCSSSVFVALSYAIQRDLARRRAVSVCTSVRRSSIVPTQKSNISP